MKAEIKTTKTIETDDIITMFQEIAKACNGNTALEDAGCGMVNVRIDTFDFGGDTIVQLYPDDDFHLVCVCFYGEGFDGESRDIDEFPAPVQKMILEGFIDALGCDCKTDYEHITIEEKIANTLLGALADYKGYGVQYTYLFENVKDICVSTLIEEIGTFGVLKRECKDGLVCYDLFDEGKSKIFARISVKEGKLYHIATNLDICRIILQK